MTFPLGKVTVKEDASLSLALSGRDAAFLLDQHAPGDWGEADASRDEAALRAGHMLVSSCRTLRGGKLRVLTTSDRSETFLFCPPGTVKYIPLPDFAHWRKQE